MNRWRVWNTNYRTDTTTSRRVKWSTSIRKPWIATEDIAKSEYFATHAEAITYADKQARRTA